jgi:peptidoglycan-N-acetylglucosamine deacetylase
MNNLFIRRVSCMMKKPMISIVIPALNEELFLPKCIASIKSQNWRGEYELIVVDNGSTDGTAKVAKEYGARVVCCPQRGVAYARQAGAEAARGEIIVQADADTLYPPDWLTKIDNDFSRDPKVIGLAGRYVYINPARWASFETFYRKFLNKAGIIVFGFPAAVSGANFAFKKATFVNSTGYDPKSLYPDQWGIARTISKYGKIRYDHNLVVETSARRIAKPAYVIFYEIIRNCCHVLWHFVRHCAGAFRKSEASVR